MIEQASPGTIFDLHRLSPKLGYSVDLDRFWLARPSSAQCPQRIVWEKNVVPLQFGHSEMVFRRLCETQRFRSGLGRRRGENSGL